MQILFAADGSKCTKKALAFLVASECLAGAGDELVVLNVQATLPPRVETMVGSEAVNEYHRDAANAVLDPIKTFLDRPPIRYRCEWMVGSPAVEIIAATRREKRT